VYLLTLITYLRYLVVISWTG